MKKLIIFPILLWSVLLFSQEEKKYSGERKYEIYVGVGYDHLNGFKFSKANDFKNYSMSTLGFRYNVLNEMLCAGIDISFSPEINFQRRSASDIWLGFTFAKFKTSHLALNVMWQTNNLSFANKTSGVNEYYNLQQQQSIGPILQYKKGIFTIETGYLFGITEKKWNNVGNTLILPKDKLNSFVFRMFANINLN